MTAAVVVVASCGLRGEGPTAPAPREVALARTGILGDGASGRVVSPWDRDQDGLADEIELDLASQYRPYWFVDATETFRSISIEDWAEIGGFNAYRDGTFAYSDLASLLAAVTAGPLGRLHLPAAGVAGRSADAPVYVEAVPMPAAFAIGGKAHLVWIHYWLLFGDDVKPFAPGLHHRGDWEHVCVMVERAAAGDRDRPPVMIHWHHHGSADVAATADAWHADELGSYHPRAYVEAGDHAMYRLPGRFLGEHDDGGGSTDDPLDDPLVFLYDHQGQAGAAAVEAGIVRRFQGRWGQTITGSGLSPRGPLASNSVCDRDFVERPSARSFALGGCGGP